MTETAAPKIKARRGDLVIVELRRSYTASSFKREESPNVYRLMMVTNLFRDGRIKLVCETRYEGRGCPQELDGMLHFTGNRWLLPATNWDVDAARKIAAEHVYPGSTTPRDFPSLETAREILAPARRAAAGA